MLYNFKSTSVILCISFLSACGGGGSGGGGDDIRTGVFTDSAVAGMSFVTATQSGTTDASGAFKYKAGETITFSIGDIVIGEAVAAKADMTPVDLVPGVILYDNANQLLKMVNSPRLTPERVAFFKLTNTLVFLQSLDDDAFPNNGITIPAGIVDLLTGVTLNFETDDEGRFKKGLRVITNRAANNDILSSGAIKPRSYALDHFYSSQNISQSFFSISTENTDSDNDGNFNGTKAFIYDDKGNWLTLISRNEAGAVTKSDIYTYDESGNLLTFIARNGADALLTNYASSYDNNGNKLTGSSDSNRNGIFEQEEITTYTYDTSGNQLTIDYGSDGFINEVTTYDTNGNILTKGTAETIYTNYSYDANGNNQIQNYDSEGNGFDESDITAFTYDAKDNLLTKSDLLETNTYTYDDNGNLLTYIQVVNSIVTKSETNTYNANGKLLTSTSLSETSTYTYDDNSNLLTYIRDESDTVTQSDTNTYDANDNLLTSTGLSQTITYTYDDNNNRLTQSNDNNGDAVIDRKITSTYIESNWSIPIPMMTTITE
jgi:YD repeat-containing protein